MDVRTGLELWEGRERERKRKVWKDWAFYVFVASP